MPIFRKTDFFPKMAPRKKAADSSSDSEAENRPPKKVKKVVVPRQKAYKSVGMKFFDGTQRAQVACWVEAAYQKEGIDDEETLEANGENPSIKRGVWTLVYADMVAASLKNSPNGALWKITREFIFRIIRT